jgi:hypothetical protein
MDTVDRPPCGSGTSNISIFGTTLEQPPSQPNGGGFNSTLVVPSVTGGTPLANGASIDLNFLFGIQQTGDFRLALIPEGFPVGGSAIFAVSGNTDAPVVSSITRVDSDPQPSGATIHFLVTFSAVVTGVDNTDFTLTTTGTIAGASVTGVTGSGNTRTVTVNAGAGTGTIRLDVTDDDTIQDGGSTPLGGAGAGNGDFTSGEVYTINGTPPSVVSINRASPDPTLSGSIVQYTVTFSEAVTGVDASDFVLTTTGSIAGATVTNVTGGGDTWTVTVNTGTGSGTIRLDVTDDDTIMNAALIPLGGNGAGNGNFTTGQVYTVTPVVPTLDPRTLMLLGCLLAVAGYFAAKRA